MSDYENLRRQLSEHGQEHLLRWWPDLDENQRANLLSQIASLDLGLVQHLWNQAVSGSVRKSVKQEAMEPAPVRRRAESFEEWEREQQEAEVGEVALRAGQVAVLLVAGGQGTRLGHPGPKGTYPIGPITQRTLFQIHAEKVLALTRRYEAPIPLCIMTSPENDTATRQFFQTHAWFGLDPGQVHFFVQGTMPAVNATTGKLLLVEKHSLALSPNGHGGVVEALARSGLLTRLEQQGVRHLFYFQVDNPLVKVADPVFLGQHIEARAEMSLKVLPKLGPEERLGVVVRQGGQLRVIEYSDLPSELACKRSPDGSLELWAGSIAIHVFDLAFLKRLAETSALPYHVARKVVTYVDDSGLIVRPEQPNAIKFERFVFDALPLARKAIIVETDRRQEFEPLKNAEGENSPTTVRQALSDLYAEWLISAGVQVPRKSNGSSVYPIEISPLFALDAEELRAKVDNLEEVAGPLVLA
ncbi:MAG: UDPGP type 1 family protein [Gemmatales bacterium]|nr:UDPGP type 1 family protein [Gemmatales bacterium]MDW8386610.1 UDPGP type 1 family protein [Gemmatales bacterium]